ncbi:hypothetical protein [Halocalculus aciditolerans]|uniref:DUF8052 domain-containing protein n=1 Tax=Halocalculus aciditolerans TaxID=1383812 RepID=A0A830FER5_9EURY|nr:hypothetical protein [Halocalculus aciditolerans]GGL47937.1 hypothetical protein GCM10009039_02670 [Halocalculus aciditolerans]
MAETTPEADADPDFEPRPEWDDPYFDEVAERLQYHYDLERDYDLADYETAWREWELYGKLDLERRKYFFHPKLSYGHHDTDEHLFARRVDAVTTDDLDALVDLGHRLADEWIVADERHYSTEFTFVLVAPGLPDDVAAYVDGFRDRTLLKYGYYGHYEVNLAVVAPDENAFVASEQAEVAAAFRTWEPLGEPDRGLFGRIADAIFG